MKNFTLNLFKVTSLTVVVLLTANVASAWDDTGHMLVSTVAYKRLNPRARARVEALTKTIRFCGKTYDPITVSTWMDDMRADSMHDDMREWHYINVPVFDGVPVDPKNVAATNNVASRLKWGIATLTLSTGSDQKDGEVLGFLYHLAGDIHQPLHAATRYTAANPNGDAGGNFFKFTGIKEADNLHRLWDTAAGAFEFWRAPRPLEAATRTRLDDYARSIETEFPADKMPEAREINPDKWAQESHALALQYVYTTKENSTPTVAYRMQAQTVARRRIALAGYRLANMINAIYP